MFEDDRYEVLLDSGAFSAKNAGVEVRMDEYVAFLNKWKHRLFGYIALDVVGNPAATAANLASMQADGLNPIPVHVYGDDERTMDHLFERAQWVALAGLRRPHRGQAPSSYLAMKMKWSKGRNVHWLGYTDAEQIALFKPFSCDCSSWMAGMRYGAVPFYFGSGRWARYSYPEFMQSKAILNKDVAAALERYGITHEQATDARLWRHRATKPLVDMRECVLSTVASRSWARYILDTRRRFGTRFFLAMSAVPDNARIISDAVTVAEANGDTSLVAAPVAR